VRKVFYIAQKVFSIAVLLVTASGLKAQSGIRFEELHSINSLSQNSVVAIHQDKLGFLWIGNWAGLNKYDGYRFRIYRLTEDSTSRAGINRITSIREDRAGNIWVQTYDGRMHRFDPALERFLSFPTESGVTPSTRITNYYESEEGLVCLSTSNLGAYFISFDSVTGETQISHIYNETGTRQKILTDNSVSFIIQDDRSDFWIGTKNGLNRVRSGDMRKAEIKPDKYLYAGTQADSGGIVFLNCARLADRLWFGTRDRGLVCYDMVHDAFVDLENDPVSRDFKYELVTTLETTGRDLWIGTRKGKILRYDSERDEFRLYPLEHPRTGKTVESLYMDNFGQVWILTDRFGITRLDPRSGKTKYYFLTPPEIENLTDDERTVIFEDSHNQLWLGGQNIGVQHYIRAADRFDVYLNDPKDPGSLPSNIVECITEDREGNLLIGTNWFGMGLSRMITIDPAFRYIRPVEFPDSKMENVIRSLFTDSKGYIWAGTKNGKIHIYDPDLKRVHTIDGNSTGFTGSNVYSVFEDSGGFIWLGTKGGGVFRSEQPLPVVFPDYRKMSFTAYQRKDGDSNSLNCNNVYDLVVDELGRVWVATYGGGLNMMEPGETGGSPEYQHFTTANSGLTSDKLRDLCLDRSGRLWLATTYGVNYIDIYRDPQLNINSLLADPGNPGSLSYNDIIMITEDRKGNIWLATAGGGVNEILENGTDGFSLRKYNKKDGLAEDYIISIIEDVYGYMWIGSDNGLTRLNPLNHVIENFGKKNGLPESLFSEKTCAVTPAGKVLFGTINGFYSVSPELIAKESFTPGICLTSLHIHNREVSPGQDDSPLEKSIAFTKEITLKPDQSNIAIEFSMLSYKSPESNQYEYMLEGFDEHWVYAGREHRAPYTNVPPGHYTFRVRGLNRDLSESNSETSLRIKVLPPFWKTGIAYVSYFLLLAGLLLLAFRITARITRLKNNLKVEHRVAESKLRFFTNISHEFRTPLTLILGPLEKLISQADLPSEARQQLALVHRNSKRLLRMVNQLLDFRKVQNEKMNLRIQKIELIPFLSQIRESFEGLARQKNIRFDLIHESDDITVWGDIQKLDSVIFNLLSNAFKFTHQHKSVSIIVKQERDPEDCIKIIIRDTGIGIESEKLKNIFDRFFVSHTEEDTGQQGTGIGLSLSMEYVRLHKGDIRVESIPGKGTDFIIRLPAGNEHFPEDVIIREREAFSYTPKIPVIEEELHVQEEPGAQTINRSDLPMVLVVEDDPEMYSYLRGILSPGYRVHEARDGLDGLDKANRMDPDLIITDIMMPNMDGIEMTRKLKEAFSTSHIPVIILSSKSEVESQVEGLNTGAEAYVPKPFNADLLLSYVHSFLSQRRKLREIFENTIELKPDEISVTPRDKIFIENVLRVVEENLADPSFTVEKLAESMNVSRTLFYKKLKGITGYQPIELIRMMRLKKASGLIETGEYNVSEVAYMVGYNDIRYFSTSFKKQFGISPSQFRKIGA
jgi:signal transduction histidine kinase/ligand-binding sensor domain-containing protein/CheY-like chemotaxis protein/AraC-like DNA-binding protein